MTKRERLPDKFLKTIHPCRDCSGGGEIVNNGLVWQTLLRRELLLSEPVCCAYEDDERIAAAAVEHGLVFQTCGDVPTARDVEVETTADAHAECPVLDVIGDNAHLGIDAPPVGDAEYVVGVEIDVDRTVLFRQDIDRRFDTPVGIETVPVVGTDPDGSVARIGIEVHARAHGAAVIVRRAAVIACLGRIAVVVTGVAVVVVLADAVQANNAAVAIRRIFFMAFSLILYE